MLKTKPERYIVHKVNQTYIWLEVLEGEDSGIRVSVPRYSSEYSDELEQRVNNLSEGNVKQFVLVSRDEESPNWRVAKISDKR